MLSHRPIGVRDAGNWFDGRVGREVPVTEPSRWRNGVGSPQVLPARRGYARSLVLRRRENR
jgi:hypothetical protein